MEVHIQEELCIICFEMYQDNKITFVCDHSICFLCYETLLQLHAIVHCPVCRIVIDAIDSKEINIIPRVYIDHEQLRIQNRNITNCICCSVFICLTTVYLLLSIIK